MWPIILPHIEFFGSLEDWKPLPFLLFFGDVDPKAPHFEKEWRRLSQKNGVQFVVGPESGLTEKEIAYFKSLGGLGVKLQSLYFKDNTAAITALGLMAHWMTEEKLWI